MTPLILLSTAIITAWTVECANGVVRTRIRSGITIFKGALAMRTLWVDMGWPACEERLATAAEANAHRAGGVTSLSLDVQ
jgi:hypothetical protein